MQEPLAPDCTEVVLRAVGIAFDGNPPLPSTTNPWDVCVPVFKAVEAMRVVAQGVYGADTDLAEARLTGFSLFPVLKLAHASTRSTYRVRRHDTLVVAASLRERVTPRAILCPTLR